MGVEQRAKASGESQITQIAGDQHVYEPGAGPAPQALLGLPEAPAELVGRDEPVRELLALLAEGEGGSRVAVVAGLAGVGKSALAVTAAHRAVERGWFADRVFSLSLHGYAPDGGMSAPQAVQEMLRRLGIRDTDHPASAQGQLALYRSRLAAYARAGQRVLIVADDAGSVAQVRDLVPAANNHRLLITSRHQLGEPGFTPRIIALDELESAPAVRLLAGAVLRARPDDPRPAREPGALAAVAASCGRLPLALTVAGALLAGDPGLPAAALAGQLADARTRLEALTFDNGDGGVPVGVRAAFGVSYARLPADQARIFRLLTVNPGPDCSAAYARLITGEGDGLRPKLAALVRASLLTEQPVGSERWRMHDLVRLYALERGEEFAHEDGRDAAIDALLASLVLDAATARRVLGVHGPADEGPHLPSVPQALHWLDSERALLVEAVGLAAGTGRTSTAMELGETLLHYFQVYAHVQEGLAVAQRLLAAARSAGDREYLGARLYDLGLVLMTAHRLDEAVEKASEALTVFREDSCKQDEGKALNLLGCLYREKHRLDEAGSALQGALEIFREFGLRHAEGTAWGEMGAVCVGLGRLPEAVVAFREAVRAMREVGDRHREASTLEQLGDALWRAGRREESLAAREVALASMRQLGNRKREGWALNGLAALLQADGRHQEARARYEEALALFVAAGDRQGEGGTRHNLAQLHTDAGRLEEALAEEERAIVLLAGSAGAAHQASAQRGLAHVLARLHRRVEAADAWERAAELSASVGDAREAASCREEAGRLRAMRGGPGPA